MSNYNFKSLFMSDESTIDYNKSLNTVDDTDDEKEKNAQFERLYRAKLKEVMKYRHLNQEDIANMLNVKQAAVSHWLSGKVKISTKVKETLLKELRISPLFFIFPNISVELGERLYNGNSFLYIKKLLQYSFEDLITFGNEVNLDEMGMSGITTLKNAVFEYINFIEKKYVSYNHEVFKDIIF